ncbi:MAG: hypothetical protein AAFZ05_12100 [Pseudomonadota bacterium]
MDQAPMSEARPATGASNAQRGIWAFLFYTLVGPFFGAVAAGGLLMIASVGGFAPAPYAGLGLGEVFRQIAPLSVAAFVWSAVPATLTGIGLLPLILFTGTAGPIAAGICGVIAFAISVFMIPIPDNGLMPIMAFAAGLVAILVRQVLISGGILRRI